LQAEIFVKRFLDDESGNFAIVMALVLVPVVGLMGVGVEYSGMLNRKEKIRSSADIAILAAAKDSASINQFYDLAENYLAANLPEIPIELVPKTYPDKVSLKISSKYPTAFLAMVGVPEFNIEVTSELAIEKFGRGAIGQPGTDLAAIVTQLEMARDQMIRQTSDLPPRKLEQARMKIRNRFDRLIKQARQSDQPVYLSK